MIHSAAGSNRNNGAEGRQVPGGVLGPSENAAERIFLGIGPVKSFRLYRECGGAGTAGEQGNPDGRRIPGTTTCTKPLRNAYGDWFLIC
jgi:hypothetical protein